MMTTFADPLDVLLNLQRVLEARTESDWLQNRTTAQGPLPTNQRVPEGGRHPGDH
jgi:hypothetical protein